MARRMKKTWHIGEYCRFGTLKILKTTKDTITLGLCHYKQTKVEVEKTFSKHFDMVMWLEDQTTHYYACEIIKEMKDYGFELKQNGMWAR